MLVLTRACIKIDCPLESCVNSLLTSGSFRLSPPHTFFFLYPKRISHTAASLIQGPIQLSGLALVPVTAGYQQKNAEEALWE